MMADAVEASSRVLNDPTPARIAALVDKIINHIYLEGQLDECELTLKDISEIKKAIFLHTHRHLPQEDRLSGFLISIMEIYLKNRQKSTSLNLRRLEKDLSRALLHLGLQSSELSVPLSQQEDEAPKYPLPRDQKKTLTCSPSPDRQTTSAPAYHKWPAHTGGHRHLSAKGACAGKGIQSQLL